MKRRLDPSSIALPVIVGATILIPVFILMLLKIDRGMGEFGLTHYYFTYDSEFLRRAFIGEALRLTNFPMSNMSVSLLYSTVVALYLVALATAVAVIFERTQIFYKALLLAFIIYCPGVGLHFSYSGFGYLDIFHVLLSGLGLIAISSLGFTGAIIFSMFLTAIGLLIHESGLLVLVPVLIAAISLKFPQRFGFIQAIAFFAGATVLTTIIWHYGGVDKLSFDEHMLSLKATADDPNEIVRSAVIVHFRDLAENVGLLLPRTNSWYWWQHIKFIVLASPFLFLIGRYAISLNAHYIQENNRAGGVLLIFAIVSPLALYILGHDFFRWWSIVMNNFFLLLLFGCASSSVVQANLITALTKGRSLVIFAIGLGALSGGIASHVSFSIHTSPVGMFLRQVQPLF
jgi:hypothetical protein